MVGVGYGRHVHAWSSFGDVTKGGCQHAKMHCFSVVNWFVWLKAAAGVSKARQGCAGICWLGMGCGGGGVVAGSLGACMDIYIYI